MRELLSEVQAKNLFRSKIHAVDGEIGTLKDIYFDDVSWRIRYLVVDTGRWLPGRKVLLSPHSLNTSEPQKDALPVNLSKDQIRNSPDIDSDKPVSRQQEEKLSAYYGWPPVEPAPLVGGGMLGPGYTYAGAHFAQSQTPIAGTPEKWADYDPHLRSVREITGYTVAGIDGEIGRVEDLLVDLNTLRITALKIDTSDWAAGGEVTLHNSLIEEIRWDTRNISVRTSRSDVDKPSSN